MEVFGYMEVEVTVRVARNKDDSAGFKDSVVSAVKSALGTVCENDSISIPDIQEDEQGLTGYWEANLTVKGEVVSVEFSDNYVMSWHDDGPVERKGEGYIVEDFDISWSLEEAMSDLNNHLDKALDKWPVRAIACNRLLNEVRYDWTEVQDALQEHQLDW